ncbi:MAG: peptide-methionine (R)-S-oxide reductase MsrB [Anaerolineaceae bacterium]|nr:peptide-methionine (R)-S-oxide reductase MsrB [Anaerolineaceae bacterium]
MIKKLQILLLIALVIVLVSACGTTSETPITITTQAEEEKVSEMTKDGFDSTYGKKEGVDVIYLAGGCFWGLEKLMQSLPGVVDVVSGYANGNADIVPTYNKVISGQTGYRETVRVEYQPDVISLDAILFAYFQVIDPTIENAQGNDVGTQYQTGVYYADEAARATVERIATIEKERHKSFKVEIKPLARFYDAEEYHQDYLDKNPLGYCHISRDEISTISEIIIDPGNYQRPSQEEIKGMLTDLQHKVTQNAGTEPAFNNEYWDNHARGIYVDVVTGEPLFSSGDKFDSGTGWPSFTKPIDENTVRSIEDSSLGMVRIEVRSRAGNSHLGHLFYNDPVSPSGTRYCINSAALRFIPYEEMEAEGYGYLLDYVK